MTEAERIARAARAKAAYEEFFEPMIDALRDEYASRIVEIANSELSRDKRADKLTALSNAHKILATLDDGMKAILTDGDLAARDKLRAETIERMTAPQRRLLGIAPGF